MNYVWRQWLLPARDEGFLDGGDQTGGIFRVVEEQNSNRASVGYTTRQAVVDYFLLTHTFGAECTDRGLEAARVG